MIRSHLITVVVATCLLAGLAGCASRPYYSDLPEPSARAPVTRASAAPSGVNSYVVKAGDTLHSIAFAAGTDWQTLATLNRIAAPYTIYPGQLLKLSASSVPVTLGMDPDVPAAAPSREGRRACRNLWIGKQTSASDEDQMMASENSDRISSSW